MRRASVGALGLFALAVAGCKTESAKRKEVQECAAITLTVQAAATCLEVQYRWKKPAAVAAAQAFQQKKTGLILKHRIDAHDEIVAFIVPA